jgi:hypothetical protein
MIGDRALIEISKMQGEVEKRRKQLSISDYGNQKETHRKTVRKNY